MNLLQEVKVSFIPSVIGVRFIIDVIVTCTKTHDLVGCEDLEYEVELIGCRIDG